MIVLVALPSIGLAPIDAFPITLRQSFPSLLDPNLTSEVTYYRGVNIWIGPSATNLIRFGAKFTPCMRTDFGIQRRNGRLYIDPVSDGRIVCCQNQIHQGNVEFQSCVASLPNTTAIDGVGFLPQRCPNTTTFNFHPCCISITGLCGVMDATQCEARGGVFHDNAATCDEVGVRNFYVYSLLADKFCNFEGRKTSNFHWPKRSPCSILHVHLCQSPLSCN